MFVGIGTGLLVDAAGRGRTGFSSHCFALWIALTNPSPAEDVEYVYDIPSSIAEVLLGIYSERCMVWVDDMIIWGKTQDKLVDKMELVLEWLKCRGIYVACTQVSFFLSSISWTGRIHSSAEAAHLPQRSQGLTKMLRPETVSERM